MAIFPVSAMAIGVSVSKTLRSAPIELGGDWQGSLPSSALSVIMRMRDVSLQGVVLVSDKQPDTIRVDDHASGPPSIWLHYDRSKTAWIIVDVEERDWARLAYQFGHEFGHVLANSWVDTAHGRPPTQWLEESLVESFSLRGLGRLATSWETDPVFPGDSAYGAAVLQYRQTTIARYAKAIDRGSYSDLADWLRKTRSKLERPGVGINALEGPLIVALVAEFDQNSGAVSDLGALNRWPERAGLPLEEYLSRWQTSCSALHAPGMLPAWLKRRFRLA